MDGLKIADFLSLERYNTGTDPSAQRVYTSINYPFYTNPTIIPYFILPMHINSPQNGWEAENVGGWAAKSWIMARIGSSVVRNV